MNFTESSQRCNTFNVSWKLIKNVSLEYSKECLTNDLLSLGSL